MTSLLNIDEDVIKIYYDKDVKLFGKNFIDITLKTSQSIRESKRNDLVLKMAVPGIKDSFLLVILLNFHLLVGTSQVKLDEAFGLT